MITPKTVYEVLRKTVEDWTADRAPQMAAALAFYTLFSLTPLLLMSIAIAGLFFGGNTAQTEVINRIAEAFGDDVAQTAKNLIEGATRPGAEIVTLFSLVTLFLGAAGMFNQIKSSLQTIWKVNSPAPKNGFWTILFFVRDQFFSILLVMGCGLLLLASLVIGVASSALMEYASGYVVEAAQVFQTANTLLTVTVLTLIFAAAFKYLPGIKIPWRDVITGALLTMGLFMVGRILIGVYLSHSTIGSAYGAAGSLVIAMVWVNYSAMIFFLGAEFTRVWFIFRTTGFEPLPLKEPSETDPVPPPISGISLH